MKNSFKIMGSAILLALSGSLSAATVVSVNGVKIDSSDIERRAKNVQTNSQGQVSDSPQLRQYITNELITEQLVVQEAKRLKLDKSTEYQTATSETLKEIKNKGLDKEANFKQNWADYQNHLLMMVYAEDVLKKNPVSDSLVQQRYNQIKSRYHQTHEIQIGEIVTQQAADAENAIKALNSKKKFADVAKQYSISPSKNHGGIAQGYMALVDIKDANPNVHQAIASLAKGQYTKTPIKDNNVLVILMVNDKRQINVPSYEQMQAQIKEDLQAQQVNSAIEQLGKKASIVPAK